MSSDGSNYMFGMTSSGMPLCHLDYGYIGKCTDPAELEKIIKILRSGEEGTYPQLITFAEKQLESINPKSKVLRKDIPIQSYNDIKSNERDQITGDFNDWISEISTKDTQLKTNGYDSNHSNIPPVRSAMTVGSTTSDDSKVSSNSRSKGTRSAAPRGYHDWDKFNIDKELQSVDEKEEKELKTKKEKAKINSKENDLPSIVNKSGKSEAELDLLANREKDKGNEAFRCGDYKESLVYYTRSIQYKPTAASYNNRAFANLKLKKFGVAIEDCNRVIDMEPNNLKALLRRALAQKEKGDSRNARLDLEKVLQIEPNNKRAQEIMNEMSSMEEKSKTASNTNLYEEIHTKKKGKRMKIIEVENNEEDVAVEEEKLPLNAEQKQTNSHIDVTDGNCISQSSKTMKKTPDMVQNGIEDTLQAKTTTKSLQLDKNDQNHASQAHQAELESKNTQPQPNVTENVQKEEPSVKNSPPPPPVALDLPKPVLMSKDEAIDLYKLGRYAEATEKFSRAIELLEQDKTKFKSAFSSLLNNRAACLQRMGDAIGCIKDCTSSLYLLPGSIKPLLKRASSNEMLERYEEAFIDFNQVALMCPSDQTAMCGKARVTKHLINTYGTSWRKRVETFRPSGTNTSKELLNSEINGPAVEKSLLVNGKAVSLTDRDGSMQNTKCDKESMVKSAVKESKGENTEKKFELFKEKGNLCVKQGKLDEAVKCYTDCIDLDPSKVAVYTNRALCFLRLKKFSLAEEDCNTALGIHGDNVKALYRRALARKGLEKFDEAAKDLLNLVKIEPANTSGKKELDIVLNLCREQRKRQKETANKNTLEQKDQSKSTSKTTREPKHQSKSTINTTGEQKNQSKSEPAVEKSNGKQRRRIQIEEVNKIEDSKTSKPNDKITTTQTTSNSSPQTPTSNSSHQINSHTASQQVKTTNSPSNAKKKQNAKLHKANAFDFYQAWNSVKKGDLRSYAAILRQLNPVLLPKVLSNKLDGDMFRCIVGTVAEQLLSNGEEKLSFDILSNLCQAQRFDMVKMFLDNRDKKAIKDIFNKLADFQVKSEFVHADKLNELMSKYNS